MELNKADENIVRVSGSCWMFPLHTRRKLIFTQRSFTWLLFGVHFFKWNIQLWIFVPERFPSDTTKIPGLEIFSIRAAPAAVVQLQFLKV